LTLFPFFFFLPPSPSFPPLFRPSRLSSAARRRHENGCVFISGKTHGKRSYSLTASVTEIPPQWASMLLFPFPLSLSPLFSSFFFHFFFSDSVTLFGGHSRPESATLSAIEPPPGAPRNEIGTEGPFLFFFLFFFFFPFSLLLPSSTEPADAGISSAHATRAQLR